LTECPLGGDHDEHCRAVEVHRGKETVKLGGGYVEVEILWTRTGNAGGPDLLLLGNDGGSGGDGDLFAVTLSSPVSVQRLRGERYTSVRARMTSTPLILDMPFDIEYFNNASHADAIIVPFPVRWAGGDFVADLREMTRRTYSTGELSVRTIAVRNELHGWASDRYPTTRLYPPEARAATPVTGRVLVEMLLSGHADQARDLLARAWPHDPAQSDKPLGGQEDFWAAICAAVVRQPSWQRFGFARLPHAALIEQGARGARPA
jgi:hypothetical protein